MTEIDIAINYCKVSADLRMQAAEGTEYQGLRAQEPQLQRELREHLDAANAGDALFKSYRDIGYLVHPFGTVVYPVYFAWILLGGELFLDDNFEKVWPKVKSLLKDPELHQKLINIDLATITDKMVATIQGLRLSLSHHHDKSVLCIDMVDRIRLI